MAAKGNPTEDFDEELVPIQMEFYNCYMQLLDFAETGSQRIITNMTINIDVIRNKIDEYELGATEERMHLCIEPKTQHAHCGRDQSLYTPL